MAPQSPLCFGSAWRRNLGPLPCVSSPHTNRFAGFARGPRWRRKVRFASVPPGGETWARSLASPLPTQTALLTFARGPCVDLPVADKLRQKLQ